MWTGTQVTVRRTEFLGLAVRLMGSHTSFFWKDDIKAEAMTRTSIPRLHCMESGSNNIECMC